MSDTEILNHQLLNNWFSLNPNLDSFSFDSKFIKSNKYEFQINISKFLVSDMLENKYISENIYTLTAQEFIKILKMNLKAEEFLHSRNKQKEFSDETIINVTISNSNDAVIITNHHKKYLIKKFPYTMVANTYKKLSNKNSYVLLDELLLTLSGNEIIFINLLYKTSPLSDEEKMYMNSIVSFYKILLSNEDMLCSYSLKFYNLFNNEIRKLLYKGDLTLTQIEVINKYTSIVNNYMLEKQEEQKKEEITYNKSSSGFFSLGYSSLALILTTTILVGVSCALLFLFKF